MQPRRIESDFWVQLRSVDRKRWTLGADRIRRRDRTWHRNPAETEDAFRTRVAAEAEGRPPRLFVCFSDQGACPHEDLPGA
jgi:hypothetical protein